MNHLNNRFSSSDDETISYSQKSSTGFRTDSILTYVLILGGLFGLYYVPKTAFSQPSGEEAVNIRLTSSKFSKTPTAELFAGKKKKRKKVKKSAKSNKTITLSPDLPLEIAVIGAKESGNRLEFYIQGLEEDQQYTIDFGDGNQQTIESATFDYTYDLHGDYEVKLQAEQNDGEALTTYTTVVQIESPVLTSLKDEKSKI